METALQRVKNWFDEIVQTIDGTFGAGYSAKNPDLIRHMLDKVQQQTDRDLSLDLN